MTRKQIKTKFPDLTPAQRYQLRKTKTAITKAARTANAAHKAAVAREQRIIRTADAMRNTVSAYQAHYAAQNSAAGQGVA